MRRRRERRDGGREGKGGREGEREEGKYLGDVRDLMNTYGKIVKRLSRELAVEVTTGDDLNIERIRKLGN